MVIKKQLLRWPSGIALTIGILIGAPLIEKAYAALVIDLSTLTFTKQADIVPAAGTTEQIVNTGTANTLRGNDKITGTSTSSNPGIDNTGTINTDFDNDSIFGTGSTSFGTGAGYGIINRDSGTIDVGQGSDIISGSGTGIGGPDSGTNTNYGKGVINFGSPRDAQ